MTEIKQTEPKPIAERYHQETKYHEADMASNQQPINWSAQPSPFKDYHSDNKIDLTAYLPLRTNPFTGEPIETPTEDIGHPFGLGALSRLLYFTNGVTGILQYPSGESLFMRAAPTAGGLYPTEIYVAVRNLSILADGIYSFQVKGHSLVLAWEGNFWTEFERYSLEHEAIRHASLLVITTAVFQRSTWRYHERAYRRILLDTGHVLGNLITYAPEEGFSPYAIGPFVDSALNRLLFLDESQEGALALVALPETPLTLPLKIDPRIGKSPLPQKKGCETDLLDPLLLQLHRGSSITQEKTKPSEETPPPKLQTFDPPQKFSHDEDLAGTPINWEEGVGPTILMRRSTRSFTGDAISRKNFASMMSYAYDTPALSTPFLFSSSQLETYVVIQDVTGLESGVYCFDHANHRLGRIYEGNFQQETWHFCLGQDLAKDAAAIVIHAAALEGAMAVHGNRAYRYLHLDAGFIGQRLNLAATRLGLGVSGIGGFYDDEVNALLGLPLDKIIVYITTLGHVKQIA